MTEETPTKRKGRGLGKRPAMFNTSVRLPQEVMDYFNTHYPYSKQAMMREILLEYVRNKLNQPQQTTALQGANHGNIQETRPSVQEVNDEADYEGLSEEEIDRLVAERYHRKGWTPVG